MNKVLEYIKQIKLTEEEIAYLNTIDWATLVPLLPKGNINE